MISVGESIFLGTVIPPQPDQVFGRQRFLRDHCKASNDSLPDLIDSPPSEDVDLEIFPDKLDIPQSIAGHFRKVPEIQQSALLLHYRLPHAIGIDRNRECARIAAQKLYREMTPPCMPPIRGDCGDDGLTPQSLSIGSKIHPVGVTYVIQNSSADSHHSNSPTTISARVIQ